LAETWHITKGADCCCGCGREFAANRLLFSCLIEADSDFERRDLCADCWESGAPADLFCFWRTRRTTTVRKPVLDAGMMFEFFDRLEGSDDEQKQAFRFVLALYLMRRKELKLVEASRGDEREVLVFRRRADGQRVEVENPGITEERLEEIASRLSQLLNACLEESSEAPAPS
jgi:hypothetical protein